MQSIVGSSQNGTGPGWTSAVVPPTGGRGPRLVLEAALPLRDLLQLLGILLERVGAATLLDRLLRLVGDPLQVPEVDHQLSPPGFLRGTSTARLNSATSVPSWLYARVCTRTTPRSGFDSEGRTSRTSDSTKRVSPWKTGLGCMSSSVARLAIALPETSLTVMPKIR